MKTPTELEAAVRAYQSGNREAFDKVYEMSHRYLYVCIEHLVRDEDAAKDLLQETYLDITRNISQLRSPEDFLSWAAAIARHRCCAYFKKADKWILTKEGEDGQELIASIADDEAFIPESILQDREKRRLIREIIDGLSDMQRLCVIAYYYQERRQEEIAEELGIPVNTVKSHLNRAKAKIKQEILALEKEKDTKLYTLAPFMLLFLAEEAEACEAVLMSEELRDTVQGNRVEEENQSSTSKRGGLAKVGIKGRILLGAAVVLGAAAVIGALVFLSSEEEPEPVQQLQQEPIQPQEAQAKSDEQVQEEVDDEAVEAESEAAEESTGDKELAISGKYERMGLGRDGIIVVSTGGKWGLVTYDDQIIVPIEYDYACAAPNDDGQTFFGKEGDFRVFDREGNELFQTDKPIKAVSDGIVLWTQTGEDMIYHFGYVKLDGTAVFTSDGEDMDEQAGAVGFNEGYAFSSSGDEYTEYRISEDGTVDDIFMERDILRHPDRSQERDESSTVVVNGTSGRDVNLFYPIGACYKGYYVDTGIQLFEDTNGKYDVNDAQGTQQYRLEMDSVAERAGYPYEGLSWSIRRFYHNGNYCYSNQTKMAVTVYSGDESKSYLIDTAKQETRKGEYGGTREFLTDEAVLAEGDYIGIADTDYWLYQKDDQWGYIDQNGNEVQMFDDAAQFYDGKAMVIVDGNAHFIDEDMNLSDWKIPAQSVSGYGEVFAVMTEDGQKCYLADEH